MAVRVASPSLRGAHLTEASPLATPDNADRAARSVDALLAARPARAAREIAAQPDPRPVPVSALSPSRPRGRPSSSRRRVARDAEMVAHLTRLPRPATATGRAPGAADAPRLERLLVVRFESCSSDPTAVVARGVYGFDSLTSAPGRLPPRRERPVLRAWRALEAGSLGSPRPTPGAARNRCRALRLQPRDLDGRLPTFAREEEPVSVARAERHSGPRAKVTR